MDDLETQLVSLGLRLAEVQARNALETISTQIRTAKNRKKDAEAVRELEEIINDLISDRAELIRIAEQYRQYLSAQEISDGDVFYIAENLVPQVKRVIEMASGDEGVGFNDTEEMIEFVRLLLSPETIKVAQLLGLNLRRAIGEPATELIAQRIQAASATDTDRMEISRLELEREIAFMDLVRDEAAFARWQQLTGQP